MLRSLVGLRPEKDCAGEAQQQMKNRPNLSSERAPHINKPVNCLKIIKGKRRKIGHISQMGA
jgi:hypothetical protein